MGTRLDPVRKLLGEMAQDDYVRFKFGKRVDAALKLIDQADTGPDAAALEARLLELLDVVRGGKGGRKKGADAAKKGAGAAAPEVKSAPRARKKAEGPDAAS